MKVTIVGLERISGISQKTGKPYNIGRLHTLLPVDPVRSENQCVIGMQGAAYENVDVELIKRIENNSVPFEAELTVIDMIRFGKREGRITDIRPIQRRPDVATPSKAA